MSKFKKKPIVIEAMQFDVGSTGNIERFCPKARVKVDYKGAAFLSIETLEGVMRADLNDWIIKGVKGEFYPCKPDIFAATYEPVED